MRLVDDDLVEAHRRVHPPHVRRLVPEKGRETDASMSKYMIGIAHCTGVHFMVRSGFSE